MSTKAKEKAAPKMPATAIRTRLAPRGKKSCKSAIIISSSFSFARPRPKCGRPKARFRALSSEEAGSGAPVWRAGPFERSPSLLALKADRSPPRRPQLSAVQACCGRCSNALHAPVSKERFQSASGAGSAESSAHCAGADVNSQLS